MQKTAMYKRCLWLLVALTLLALPILSLAEDYLVVIGGALNLRQEASISSKLLGQYPTGTWVAVQRLGTNWTKVKVDGKAGFMMSKYLSDKASSVTMYIRTNTGANLNFRKAPSMEGAIMTSIANGTKVNVITRGTDWHKVNMNGVIGFMASRYLRASASGGNTSNASGYPKTGLVNNPGANQVLLLRETASIDARVIGNYGNGVSVQLLGESGSFYKVAVDGKSGYMMKKYVKVVSSVPAAPSGPSITAGLPEAPFVAKLFNPNGNGIVNFRNGVGLSAGVIKAYPVGTEVVILEVGENWCRAQIGDVVGYVSTYFFRVGK